MNHTAVVEGMDFVADAVEYLSTKFPLIPLSVGEVGSALNPTINDFQLESVLGAALWQVDFMLYAMSLVSVFAECSIVRSYNQIK